MVKLAVRKAVVNVVACFIVSFGYGYSLNALRQYGKSNFQMGFGGFIQMAGEGTHVHTEYGVAPSLCMLFDSIGSVHVSN